MRVLVTGARGQLGSELCRQLGAAAVAADRAKLDITDAAQVQELVTRVRPTVLINCAASTGVDQAEAQPLACAAVNADAVRHLVSACLATSCAFVQISTDFVFGADPQRSRPYQESDTPSPQSAYARTKLIGEQHAAGYARHFIVRTCGLYGIAPSASCFVERILRLASEKRQLRVVNDQRCTPSYAVHVARAVLFLAATSAYGTYHVVNQGETTWYWFAQEVLRQAGITAEVEPITTDEWRAAAARPHYSVLDTTKYHALGGPAMPHWSAAIAEYLARRLPTPQ